LLKELNAQFHERGLQIVGVSIDDDREKFDLALKNPVRTWPQVFDALGLKGKVVELFNARGVPVSYLIDRDGRIAVKITSSEQLRAQVTKLMEKP
jgi:peroxiredoxin